jgi:hypothetical protein
VTKPTERLAWPLRLIGWADEGKERMDITRQESEAIVDALSARLDDLDGKTAFDDGDYSADEIATMRAKMVKIDALLARFGQDVLAAHSQYLDDNRLAF